MISGIRVPNPVEGCGPTAISQREGEDDAIREGIKRHHRLRQAVVEGLAGIRHHVEEISTWGDHHQHKERSPATSRRWNSRLRSMYLSGRQAYGDRFLDPRALPQDPTFRGR